VKETKSLGTFPEGRDAAMDGLQSATDADPEGGQLGKKKGGKK